MDEESMQSVMTNELSKHVLSELDVLMTLNINRRTLDTLRLEKKLPYVRLSLQSRVYLIDSLVTWLKAREIKHEQDEE